MNLRKLGAIVIATLGIGMGLIGNSQAGSIFLTGHDVDLHNGQNGYDNIVINWLRGAGTAGEISASSYNIGVLRSPVGFIGNVGLNMYEGFGSVDVRDVSSFANSTDFATWLSTKNLLSVSSHTSCGGCALTTDDSDTINTWNSQISAFFNSGGDIWGISGASLSSYYNFLPPGAVASGLPISGSAGFTATAAGTSIGILSSNINGFPTHNRFTAFDPDFTVFETRGSEVISIGIRDATITDGGIGVCGGAGQPECAVPEPETLPLIAVGMMAMVGGLLNLRKSTRREDA
jgi:hypothetical protein